MLFFLLILVEMGLSWSVWKATYLMMTRIIMIIVVIITTKTIIITITITITVVIIIFIITIVITILVVIICYLYFSPSYYVVIVSIVIIIVTATISQPLWGVASGTQRIVGLGKFWPDLGISARFLPGLGGWFFLVWFRNRLSLGLGFPNKGLGESRILPFATPIVMWATPSQVTIFVPGYGQKF